MKHFKKRYNLKEYYRTLVLGHRSVLRLLQNRLKPRLDSAFIERLMLAVTEVNGCEVCSYAHTHMALKQGFSKEEIDSFLSASDAYVVAEEADAILFAQHYADTKGLPKREAYQALVRAYGSPRSRMITAAIQVMMVGNTSGLPMSALYRRLHGNPYTNSSAGYEVGMLASNLLLVPMSVVHAVLRLLAFRGNLRFSRASEITGDYPVTSSLV